jgi:hypothetical protein
MLSGSKGLEEDKEDVGGRKEPSNGGRGSSQRKAEGPPILKQ